MGANKAITPAGTTTTMVCRLVSILCASLCFYDLCSATSLVLCHSFFVWIVKIFVVDLTAMHNCDLLFNFFYHPAEGDGVRGCVRDPPRCDGKHQVCIFLGYCSYSVLTFMIRTSIAFKFYIHKFHGHMDIMYKCLELYNLSLSISLSLSLSLSLST